MSLAVRLTEEQKKKIRRDYEALGSYAAAARENQVSSATVRRLLQDAVRKKLAGDIIDKSLVALNNQDKLEEAKPDQITRALKTLLEFTQEESGEEAPEGPIDIPSRLIARDFVDVHRDILARGHTEYMLKGGRGSAKSSFIALEIVTLIKNHPDLNALVLRKVARTLQSSVFNQIVWAIDALELGGEFSAKVSVPEIVYKPTGQTIAFAGLDDPLKLKSIKPKVGYTGILWFEELDQFAGPEEIRSVRQSAIRGGDEAWVFMSFNPPKARNNWANREAEQPKAARLVSHTDYRSVPPAWLGESFLEEAEFVRQVSPTAYEHEYLGIPNGNGGMVFENLAAETIGAEQIARFDRPLYGVDWGFFPDPWAFNGVYFDAARRVLYIFRERTAYKKGNRETAEMVLASGVGDWDILTADSAEPKSVADYRSFGLNCRGAKKGPGSVDYSMKWLQSLVKIVIDPERCPDTYREFMEYEYERTKNGELISGYPDKNNHHIDAVRYATEEIWKWMGE